MPINRAKYERPTKSFPGENMSKFGKLGRAALAGIAASTLAVSLAACAPAETETAETTEPAETSELHLKMSSGFAQPLTRQFSQALRTLTLTFSSIQLLKREKQTLISHRLTT